MERSYRLSDVVNDDFLRFPLTLLANPKYREISLEAKFIYSLLLNRLTLSQKNGWVNADNEVYLIYTREEAANILSISYRKAIAAFRELIKVGLLFEQRQGRGYPNLLYVLKAELSDTDAGEFAEQINRAEYGTEAETATDLPPVIPENDSSANSAVQDVQKLRFKTCKNGSSGCAGSAVQDVPNLHTKKIENKNTENIQIENSLSVYPRTQQSDGPTDEERQALQEIFDKCELHLFQPNIRVMFRTVVERLFYSDTLKIGNARLPREKVRSYLYLLDAEVLMTALERMKENEGRIVNPTAYLMSILFNAICEKDSDLILSLPPGYLYAEDFYITADEGKEMENDAP